MKNKIYFMNCLKHQTYVSYFVANNYFRFNFIYMNPPPPQFYEMLVEVPVFNMGLAVQNRS